MYAIRSALRASTGRAPARLIHGRRYPSLPRLRSLHTTHPLAFAATPPDAPDSTPTDTNGASNPDRDTPVAPGEQHDPDVAAEDPDVLAQKVQRSRETTRRYLAAQRRQQRRTKSQGLPPVEIPDWFLRKSVLRREALPAEVRQHIVPKALSLVVSHAESGQQATCSIPASRDLDAVKVLSRLVRGMWGRRLDEEAKRKIEQYIEDKTAALEGVGAEKAAVGDAEPGATPEQDPKPVDTEMDPRKKLADVFDQLESEANTAQMQQEAARLRQTRSSKRMSPLVLAEIRATIAASLSALRPSTGDSFPSTKTNLILHSPLPEHEKMVDRCVQAVALELESDMIVLRAQDLAQLAGDYLGEGAEPSPRSIRSLGYETYRLSSELNDAFEDVEREGAAEDELDHSQSSSMEQPDQPKMPFALGVPIFAISPALKALAQNFKSMQMPASNPFENAATIPNDEPTRMQSQGEMQLEDLKLASLLEALVDSNELKRSRGIASTESEGLASASSKDTGKKQRRGSDPSFFNYSVSSEGLELDLHSTLPPKAKSDLTMSVNVGPVAQSSQAPKNSKIIYVKDYKELNATHYGGRIIQKLEELVRKRRSLGESVMIVGSTCSRELTPELSMNGVHALQSEGESSYFRTIVVAADSSKAAFLDESTAASKGEVSSADVSAAEKSKFSGINLMHIQDMLRGLDPVSSADVADMDRSPKLLRYFAAIIPKSCLNRVLTYDEVHRIALTALGLHVTSPSQSAEGAQPQLNWAHVALAMGLLKASDTAKFLQFERAAQTFERHRHQGASDVDAEAKLKPKPRQSEAQIQRQRELQQISSTADKYEKRLMPGIANPDQIKTTFDQVHVPKETVDSIRTITSLSLLRPDAFDYGILATEKISGALLYGPPGTGKTLLAKAVAKESGSTVLEVSGSQIMDKYVGEGEKNVAAIFSLARKLSPCIVFLDEADAVFASRDAMRERSSHRDILNQFLKEWDGLNDLSVFVMVATNRPFDLDDAVIRRLPRRLLVDLPTQDDRKEILRIHLKGEQLDESVDLADLAKRTPFYSGSDLKNVAVSAALACVKEENEQAALAAAEATSETNADAGTATSSEPTPSETTTSTTTPTPTSTASPTPPSTAQPTTAPLHLVRGTSYTFPAKRTLHARHFDKALQEISASISEDMSSLSAIKKFDEQFGDGRGKRGKKDFGFGGVQGPRDESAARVRKGV
jgi:SpoVK/Ycf46/Vps4 family AAA+-type ATPase